MGAPDLNASASGEDSATGLKLQMLHLAQDLGEVRRRHLSTRDLAAGICQGKEDEHAFGREVEQVKAEVGVVIADGFKEIHGLIAELREESASMQQDCDNLLGDDHNMGALLRRMGGKLRTLEQNIGHS